MNPVRGLKISHDGIITIVPIESLDDMQAVVGGYIETVELHQAVMCVNEEGLIMKLPVNRLASSMAGHLIVGNVLILGPVDEYDEFTGVPTAVILGFREQRRKIGT